MRVCDPVVSPPDEPTASDGAFAFVIGPPSFLPGQSLERRCNMSAADAALVDRPTGQSTTPRRVGCFSLPGGYETRLHAAEPRAIETVEGASHHQLVEDTSTKGAAEQGAGKPRELSRRRWAPLTSGSRIAQAACATGALLTSQVRHRAEPLPPVPIRMTNETELRTEPLGGRLRRFLGERLVPAEAHLWPTMWY